LPWRPVRERPIDFTGENAHGLCPAAWREIVEELLAEVRLVDELDPTVRMERPHLLDRPIETRLVGRLGEAPDDQEHVLAVRAAELDRRVRPGQRPQRVIRPQEGKGEPDGFAGAGGVDQARAMVGPFDQPILREHLECPLGTRERRVEHGRELGRSDARRALGCGEQGTQGEFGSNEASHRHAVTLPA
jgi:hypothetical protein